jgi:hypothetical protein
MLEKNNPYLTVLEILYSGKNSLRELAEISGRDPFSFYREADLNDLDLSGQDLKGLDFAGANLRGSILKNSAIDLGALNNSVIDEEYRYLTDEFDISVEDYISIFDKNIYSYCKFRHGWLDDIFYSANLSFSEFSAHAGIGESTLRKARRSIPVMNTTALQICKGLKEGNWETSGLYSRFPKKFLEMSNISIGYYSTSNKWTKLSRKEYVEICKKSAEIFEYISKGREVSFVEWSRGPDMVEWQYGFYIMDNFGHGHGNPI